MNLESFRAGTIVKQPTGYRSFIPEPINSLLTWTDPTMKWDG